ncbi:MAG: sugar phosphate isomerase/epimerase [Caldilineaceae bacterium]|nr:sugar phosphate isomerase/epimerase [Caldilineaceae bacterium]
MYLSCCVWALTAHPSEVLSDMRSLGFHRIDIRPDFLIEGDARTLRETYSLGVSSVAASFGVPDDAALESADADARRRGVAHIGSVVNQCAALGAKVVYLVPGKDDSPATLSRYAESLEQAAENAAAHGVRLCIEHFPGTALPTASATLDFINAIDHPNLGLLFDIGHVQMSGEDPAEVIKAAGSRLYYVHLDDNDGHGDLHWALLDGVLTTESLRDTFRALQDIGYVGAVSLELSPVLDDPYNALERSRQIAIDCGSDFALEP